MKAVCETGKKGDTEVVRKVTARQIEFSMAVSVCAWCKPSEKGAGLGAISHGICPRHLQELMRELHHTTSPVASTAVAHSMRMPARLTQAELLTLAGAN